METWKDIKGYERAYKVSDMGRVRSLYRSVKMAKRGSYFKLKGRILAQAENGGFFKVTLYKDRRPRTHRVHRLVLESFKGLPEDGDRVCNHIDRNRLNNCLSNLEWTTRTGAYTASR